MDENDSEMPVASQDDKGFDRLAQERWEDEGGACFCGPSESPITPPSPGSLAE
jgi:hypothetical protein